MKSTLLTSILFLFIAFTSFSQNSNTMNSMSEEELMEGLEAMSSMFGGNSEVEVADSYSFSTSVNILITIVDEKKENTEMRMKMSFPKEDDYYGMEILSVSQNEGEMPDALIVFDYANFKMITFMEQSGQKMGLTMDLNADQIEDWTDAQEADDMQNVEFTKTGKTKDILGYNCVHYTMKGTTGKGDYWVSDDEDLKIGVALNSMLQSSKNSSYEMPDDYPEGAVLEMNYSDESGSEMHWLATSINKDDEQSINTSEYNFINMGQ